MTLRRPDKLKGQPEKEVRKVWRGANKAQRAQITEATGYDGTEGSTRQQPPAAEEK